MAPIARRGEEGSALILALAFLSLFGLAIAAILGQVDANVRTTLVVRTHEAKVYGADAGIDYAIQTLRADPTVCPDDTAGQQSIPEPPLEGQVDVDLVVTCKTTEGNVLGVRGYAIVTTEAKGGPSSLDTSNGSDDRVIEGPVWVDGDVALAKPVKVDGAPLFQKAPCQSTPIDKLTVTPSPPFAVTCTTGATPDEDHGLPDVPTGVQPAAGDGGVSCRTFSPGRYTTVPALVASNFFKSGTYYFEDIGDWTITAILFGGTPQDDEAKLLTEAPCASEPASTAARGVMFVLGGNSRMIVRDHARIELFTPNAAAVDPGGDPGISLRAVLGDDASPWKASTPGTAILDVFGGNTRDMAVHGLVYTPQNVVNLFVTGGTVDAQLQGGAKVLRMGLATSNSGRGLKVSTKSGGGRRTVTLVSKALDPDGGRTVEARAVVRIANDAARTVTIVSRSVQ